MLNVVFSVLMTLSWTYVVIPSQLTAEELKVNKWESNSRISYDPDSGTLTIVRPTGEKMTIKNVIRSVSPDFSHIKDELASGRWHPSFSVKPDTLDKSSLHGFYVLTYNNRKQRSNVEMDSLDSTLLFTVPGFVENEELDRALFTHLLPTFDPNLRNLFFYTQPLIVPGTEKVVGGDVGGYANYNIHYTRLSREGVTKENAIDLEIVKHHTTNAKSPRSSVLDAMGLYINQSLTLSYEDGNVYCFYYDKYASQIQVYGYFPSGSIRNLGVFYIPKHIAVRGLNSFHFVLDRTNFKVSIKDPKTEFPSFETAVSNNKVISHHRDLNLLEKKQRGSARLIIGKDQILNVFLGESGASQNVGRQFLHSAVNENLQAWSDASAENVLGASNQSPISVSSLAVPYAFETNEVSNATIGDILLSYDKSYAAHANTAKATPVYIYLDIRGMSNEWEVSRLLKNSSESVLLILDFRDILTSVVGYEQILKCLGSLTSLDSNKKHHVLAIVPPYFNFFKQDPSFIRVEKMNVIDFFSEAQKIELIRDALNGKSDVKVEAKDMQKVFELLSANKDVHKKAFDDLDEFVQTVVAIVKARNLNLSKEADLETLAEVYIKLKTAAPIPSFTPQMLAQVKSLPDKLRDGTAERRGLTNLNYQHTELSKTLLAWAYGSQNGQPTSSFVFMGPPGSGKTETVRNISYFVDHTQIEVVNFAEYSQKGASEVQMVADDKAGGRAIEETKAAIVRLATSDKKLKILFLDEINLAPEVLRKLAAPDSLNGIFPILAFNTKPPDQDQNVQILEREVPGSLASNRALESAFRVIFASDLPTEFVKAILSRHPHRVYFPRRTSSEANDAIFIKEAIDRLATRHKCKINVEPSAISELSKKIGLRGAEDYRMLDAVIVQELGFLMSQFIGRPRDSLDGARLTLKLDPNGMISISRVSDPFEETSFDMATMHKATTRTVNEVVHSKLKELNHYLTAHDLEPADKSRLEQTKRKYALMLEAFNMVTSRPLHTNQRSIDQVHGCLLEVCPNRPVPYALGAQQWLKFLDVIKQHLREFNTVALQLTEVQRSEADFKSASDKLLLVIKLLLAIDGRYQLQFGRAETYFEELLQIYTENAHKDEASVIRKKEIDFMNRQIALAANLNRDRENKSTREQDLLLIGFVTEFKDDLTSTFSEHKFYDQRFLSGTFRSALIHPDPLTKSARELIKEREDGGMKSFVSANLAFEDNPELKSSIIVGMLLDIIMRAELQNISNDRMKVIEDEKFKALEIHKPAPAASCEFTFIPQDIEGKAVNMLKDILK